MGQMSKHYRFGVHYNLQTEQKEMLSNSIYRLVLKSLLAGEGNKI